MGWVNVANGVSGRRFLSVLKYGEDWGLGAQEKIVRAQIRDSGNRNHWAGARSIIVEAS